MAPRAGIEPATFRLTVERSTAELPGNKAASIRNGPITKRNRFAKRQDAIVFRAKSADFPAIWSGGRARNRTGMQGFAVLCVTIPPRGLKT